MSLFLRKIPSSQCRASLSARPSYAASSNVGRQNPQFRYFSSNYDYDDGESSRRKIALVLGSSGCLGRTVTRYLANQLDMQVLGADVVDLPDDTDTSLDAFISMPAWNERPPLGDITAALVQGISDNLTDGEEIDAIICASGGWQGDPPLPKPDVSLEEFIRGAKEYGENIEKMIEINLNPVLAANYAANRFMAEEGLFVVIGATAALSPTPGMLGYGLSKVGAHHFVHTLGETTGKSIATKSRRRQARRLRKDSEYLDTLSAVGILPTTIDTPSNRDAMPKADFNQWTKPIDIAKEIGTWIKTPPLRPHSGSLVKVHPASRGDGATFTLVR